MTLQQLKDLEAVVRYGSFRAAARALHASQPGLTKSVARLEGMARCRLVERTYQGVLLNAEGREFMAIARQVLQAAALAESWLAQGSGGR